MERTAILIHGAFGGPWTMQPLAEILRSRGWNCHLPTLRHHAGEHGDEAALNGLSIADYCDDLGAELRALPGEAVLIGHSMGGVIAQKLAAKGLARAVVLLNSSVIAGILPGTSAERSLGRELMTAGAFWEQSLRLDFDLVQRLAMNTLDAPTQRQIFAQLGPESGRAIFELFFWMFDDQQTTRIETDAVTCPLLVVSGTRDEGVSTDIARQIAGRYGDKATLHLAEGCCHYIVQDARFPEVAKVIGDWMEQA